MLIVGYWSSLGKLDGSIRRLGIMDYPSGRLGLVIVMGIGLGFICMVFITSYILMRTATLTSCIWFVSGSRYQYHLPHIERGARDRHTTRQFSSSTISKSVVTRCPRSHRATTPGHRLGSTITFLHTKDKWCLVFC
jgi:hypothetical protein